MLESVELNLTPSCLDCMSWSADGDLAVASGELVHVLVSSSSSWLRPLATLQTLNNSDEPSPSHVEC